MAGGFRFLTDPTFDPLRDYALPHVLSGDVTGFVLSLADPRTRPIYVTGDTISRDGVAAVARRFNPGEVALFAGGGPDPRSVLPTLDTNDAVEAAAAFADAVVVPVHMDGGGALPSRRRQARQDFRRAGLRREPPAARARGPADIEAPLRKSRA